MPRPSRRIPQARLAGPSPSTIRTMPWQTTLVAPQQGSFQGGPECFIQSLAGRPVYSGQIGKVDCGSRPGGAPSFACGRCGIRGCDKASLAEVDDVGRTSGLRGWRPTASSAGQRSASFAGLETEGTTRCSVCTLLGAPSASTGSVPRSANVLMRSSSISFRRWMKAEAKHRQNTQPARRARPDQRWW